MEANIYAPPQASLNSPTPLASANNLYVVSNAKFWLLSIGTVGMYSIYWYYANWSLVRDQDNEDVWPVARAIFQIFFIHSLFRRIETRLRNSGSEFYWSFEGLATLLVIGQVLSTIVGYLPESLNGLIQTLSIGLLIVNTYIESIAQRAINHAAGDASGSRNGQITVANVIWILVGLAFWGLTIYVWMNS